MDIATKLYNSKEWKTLRKILIAERGPACERCHAIVNDTSNLIGHHKIVLGPKNINDVTITLNPKNIELLCSKCHNKEPRHFSNKSHNVYIVYGSPLSGKTTLVNQLMQYGDIVFDMDKVFAAISGQPLYVKPNNLRFNVFALRDKMLDMIKTRYGKWIDAYVVISGANKGERERLAKELGAELIFVESTKEDCILRIKESSKPPEWHKYIDKWWNEYVE